MGRNPRTAPAAYSLSWPDEPCESPDAEFVRLLANKVRAALGERSVRSLATEVGMDHGVIVRLLAGQAWPEAVTVARLERGLGQRLWPPLGTHGVHVDSNAARPEPGMHD